MKFCDLARPRTLWHEKHSCCQLHWANWTLFSIYISTNNNNVRQSTITLPDCADGQNFQPAVVRQCDRIPERNQMFSTLDDRLCGLGGDEKTTLTLV